MYDIKVPPPPSPSFPLLFFLAFTLLHRKKGTKSFAHFEPALALHTLCTTVVFSERLVVHPRLCSQVPAGAGATGRSTG